MDRRPIGTHERTEGSRGVIVDAGDGQLRNRYLDLLEQTLTHTAYAHLDVGRTGANPLTRRVARLLRRRAIVGLRFSADDQAERRTGRDWPVFAYTMSGVQRLQNTRRCVERALADGVEGDLVEAGTWRGGSAMMMKGTLCAHGDEERRVYVADTFAGLPAPTLAADRGSRLHREPLLAVGVDEVRAGFERLGLLDDRVVFLEGLFADTLPAVADRRWAVIRIDGDLYESTRDALTHLWPGLAVGGFVIVDDYGAVDGCRRAVDEFRARHGITTPLQRIDWTGVWWRREPS
jgi:O-methyltransferase